MSAREHPAAVVRRRQERDVSRLLPTIRHLTERQYQLFFLFHTLIAQHKPKGIARLVDSDIAEAASALAATLETAARGVIYEHTPQAPPARIREQGATVYDHETVVVLRAIERGALEVKAPDEGDAAYVDLISRLLQVNAARQVTVTAGTPPSSGLILP